MDVGMRQRVEADRVALLYRSNLMGSLLTLGMVLR
jgi:hypothetical protein